MQWEGHLDRKAFLCRLQFHGVAFAVCIATVSGVVYAGEDQPVQLAMAVDNQGLMR